MPEAGRLRVADDRGGGVAAGARADGEGQGEGCLADPAFLRDECDRLHVHYKYITIYSNIFIYSFPRADPAGVGPSRGAQGRRLDSSN